MSRRRSTQWELFFQYLTVPLGMISGVVLVPLYLRHIPQDIFGAWLATGNVIAWLTISDPGLSGVLRQRVAAAHGRNDLHLIGETVSSGLLISCGVTAFLIAMGIAAGQLLPSILSLPRSVPDALVIRAYRVTVIGAGLMVFYYSLESVGKGMQSTLGMGIIQTTVRLAYLTFLISFLLHGAGVMALAWAQLFNGVALVLCTLVFLLYRLGRAGVHVRWSTARIAELFGVLSFTFVARGIAVIGANLDLVVVSRLLGPATTPVLALTRRIPEALRPLVDRPALAFLPAIAHLYAAGDLEKSRTVLLRLSRILLWALGLFTGGFAVLNGSFVRLWVGSHFYAGDVVNGLVCVGILLSVVTAALNGLCFSMGCIKEVSILGIVQGAFAIGLLYLGGRAFGMIGLAAAPVVAMLLTSWYLPLLFSKQLRLDRSERRDMLREVALVAVVSLATGVMFRFVSVDAWPTFIAAATGFVIVFVSLMILLSAQLKSECRTALHIVFGRLGAE